MKDSLVSQYARRNPVYSSFAAWHNLTNFYDHASTPIPSFFPSFFVPRLSVVEEKSQGMPHKWLGFTVKLFDEIQTPISQRRFIDKIKRKRARQRRERGQWKRRKMSMKRENLSGRTTRIEKTSKNVTELFMCCVWLQCPCTLIKCGKGTSCLAWSE